MRLLPNHGRRSRGLIFGPLAHRRIATGRKPQPHIFDQGRKPARMRKKNRKRPQALRRTHGPIQGRKAASLPQPLVGRENASNQTLDPLWEGAEATPPPQIPTFWKIFVDTYNFVLTVNAKALISNAHSKQKEKAYATQQETIPTQRP